MTFGYSVYFSERVRNRVVRWNPDSGATQVVAGEPQDGRSDQKLNDPYGLAFDPAGCLLIADKNSSRICRLRQGLLEPIVLRDLDGHRARRPDGPAAFMPDYFPAPTSLFAERTGTMLCSFYGDQTIYRIHPDGSLALVLGVVRNRYYAHVAVIDHATPAEVPTFPISGPTGVVSRSDGTIFFIERNYQVVRRYHPASGLHSVFPTSQREAWSSGMQAPLTGTVDSYFPASPSSLALDSQEQLYLCDPAHACVLKIDSERGEFQRVVQSGRTANTPPRQGPCALAFGPDGTAWVADSAAQVIQGYSIDPAGDWTPISQQLSTVGSSSLVLASGGMGLVVGL